MGDDLIPDHNTKKERERDLSNADNSSRESHSGLSPNQPEKHPPPRGDSLVPKWLLDEKSQVVTPLQKFLPNQDSEPPLGLYSSDSLRRLTNGLVKGIALLNSLLDQAEADSKNAVKYHSKASKLACNMLKAVLQNRGFQMSIRRLAKNQTDHADELIEIIVNSEKLQDFFHKELVLLERYNIPNAKLYVTNADATLEAVLKGNLPHTDIYVSLDRLSTVTCRLYENLENQSQKINQENRKKILKKAIVGTSGAIIAVINVQIEKEIGMSISTFSTQVGSAVIGAAVADVWGLI